jgi:hypothetical protein
MALPSSVEGAARAVVVVWCAGGGTDSLGVDAMMAPVVAGGGWWIGRVDRLSQTEPALETRLLEERWGGCCV